MIRDPWPYRYTQLVDMPYRMSGNELAAGPWHVYCADAEAAREIVEHRDEAMRRIQERLWRRISDRLNTGPMT